VCLKIDKSAAAHKQIAAMMAAQVDHVEVRLTFTRLARSLSCVHSSLTVGDDRHAAQG
jgi:hypothetical protein